MQCRNAAKYPFNFRPLVCAAFGLGAGVAIGMHISGARALLAALLLLIAAYIMHAKKQRAATVMLVCAAAGLLRVAGYAFLPREEVSEIIEKARFSRNHTPTALMPTVESLYARCDALFAEASPLARAILLGDRSTLGYFQRYAFRASGVSHTLALSGLSLLTMPVPLIFAILLSELPFKRLSKLTQTISALPYFISHVLLYAVCFSLFSPTDGAVNVILRLFYGPDYTSNLLAQPDVAWRMQTFICLYKGMGYSAIMYLSAMSGIDQELYDAASVDGAGRLAKILHVTIPGIMPTFIVLLVLNIAGMLSGAGFDQYYVFQNPMVLNKLEVLDTYIYKIGLRQNNFGFATAAGMLKSLISVMLLMLANRISKLVRGSSLY